MMRTNNHITDLDAIELSSGWNYNSKLVTGKNALLSDSLLRDIKVLSSNAKGDADILETELRAVITQCLKTKVNLLMHLKIVPLL